MRAASRAQYDQWLRVSARRGCVPAPLPKGAFPDWWLASHRPSFRRRLPLHEWTLP